MRQDRRIFTSQKITKKIQRLFFSSVFILIFGMSSVLGAGYTCPTTKKYTSCNVGYYLTSTSNGNSCEKCPSGYTSAGDSTVGQGNACYFQTTAGKVVETANSTTQTNCPATKYCPSHKVYYGKVSSQISGAILDCPAASGANVDTFSQMSTWPATAFPDATSSNTTISTSITAWKTGNAAKTNCTANYTLKWNSGSTELHKDSVPYNESLGRYATVVSGTEKGDRYISKLSAGYYLTEAYNSTYCNTTTNPKYYKKAVACPAGSYCPGYTSMPKCSDTSHTYGNDMGKYDCDTGTMTTSSNNYWTSAAKATARSSCYRTVTLNKNGGTGTINGTTGTTAASKTCYYNTSCSFPSASGLSQTGYKFKGGWGTSSSCTASTTSFTITSTASSVTYYACKSLEEPTITLNGNGATSNGTTSIYSRYNTNVYLDSARSKAMTTSANAITKPSRSYTVTYNASNGTVSPTSATATRTFNGFWSATSGGTKYIETTGYITSAGLTAGKGYTTNQTWYAQWTGGGAITLPTPTRADYVFNGWYTAASGGTKVGAAGASYTPTSNITLYAQWTQASCSKGAGVASATPTVSNNTVSCAVTCSTGYSENGGTDTTATFTKVGSAGVATVSTICEPREFTITLNGSGATTNSSPTSLYTVYGMNVYSDSARSKAMTTSANPITIPSRKYTVTYNANGGSVSTTSATATRTFNGFWSATSDGTQYIGPAAVDTTNAYITSSGITAAKTSTGSTWYARWSGGSVTLPTPTRAGCKFNGWSTSSTATSGATGSYTPTSNVTLYATWTCMSVSAPAKSLTYNGTTTTNGTAQSCANVTVSAPTSGASITYSTSSGGTYSATAPTLTNAGSTTVYYKVDASGYSTYTGSYTCSMATKAMTVSASTKTLTYSGSAQSCANVSVSVPSSGASITYSTSSGGTYSATAPTLTNAGSTTVYYKVTGSNFTTKTGSYTCTMNQANGTTTVSKTSMTITYPTTTGTFTASCSEGATPTVSSNATGVATVSISSGTATVTWKSAGSATITVNCPATTNYKASSQPVAVTCDITKYTITVSKNGGSGTLTVNGTTATGTTNVSFTCDHGSTFTLPAWASGSSSANNMTKSGSVFTGWNTTSPVTCNATKTITANWGTATCTKGTGVSTATPTVSSNKVTCAYSCLNGYGRTEGETRKPNIAYSFTDTVTGSAGVATVATVCYPACIQISLDTDKYGGTGGTQAIFKFPDSTTFYSDDTCSTVITSVTKPTKTNATYLGAYIHPTCMLNDGCAFSLGNNPDWDDYQLIDANGKISTNSVFANISLNGIATAYAWYDCNSTWEGSGNVITGACTRSTYKLAYNMNCPSGATCSSAPGNTNCTYGSTCSFSSITSTSLYAGGYKLTGWATTATGTAATSGSNMTTTQGGTVTLYAIWSQCAAGTYHPAATGTAANACSTCPATASGSDSGRDAKTDCYVSCSAKTISNGTTTVVNAKEYHNGSAYPACTYNVNCNAKYGASGNKTANPACTICANNQYSAGGTATCSTCSNAPANTNYTGPASSNSCPWACNAGYYGSSANGDTSCAACGSEYFCTGGTHRAHCSTTLKSGAATPDSYTSLSSGSWSDNTHGASASDCICNWYFSDESTTRYLMQSACQNGPTGHKYRTYSQCRSGYYATGSLGWGNWYTSCTACDNAPNNATYTSYSTPSEMYAEESNCPWECNDGYNLTADNQCGQFCTSGITHIKLGNGLTIPLYSSARTSPAINVKVNNAVCYGSLATGQSSGALNVKVGSTTYHAVQ